VLLDNLTRLYNVVSGKVAAKGKETEDSTKLKSNKETKEEEVKQSE
jgi:hypothetical protein